MILYEYEDGRGAGAWRDWSLQVRQRTRVEAKLRMLKDGGRVTAQSMLRGIRGYRGLFKLQVKVQNEQLRPIFCYGHLDEMKELTFLLGPFERGWKWEPAGAPETAMNRKLELQERLASRGAIRLPEVGRR